MVAAGQAGVPLSTVGRFTGATVRLGNAEAPLDDLQSLYKSAFADALG